MLKQDENMMVEYFTPWALTLPVFLSLVPESDKRLDDSITVYNMY